MKIYKIIFFLASVSIITNCKKKTAPPKEKEQKKVEVIDQSSMDQPPSELVSVDYGAKGYLKKYYEIPHIQEFYEWQDMKYQIWEPKKFPEDLSVLSYDELRLLRNEIYARNGHLFDDAFLRGHFNRSKWYMPIFDVDDFEVILSEEEQELISKIKEEEEKRKELKTITDKNRLELYNADLIVNKKQFKEIPQKVQNDFSNQNFSILEANRSMPFYTYDENAYEYIPHYITTDLYLFILHKYFSTSLEKLDENFMYVQLKTILEEASYKLSALAKNEDNKNLKSSLEWAQMYTATAQYAMGEKKYVVPDDYALEFDSEKEAINLIQGEPSFIPNILVNYKELKPRGHYTKSDTLKKYFKGFKWISLNGINIKNKKELKGLITMAYAIKSDQNLYEKYQQYVSIIEKLAGQEDNLSMANLIQALGDTNLEETLSDTNVNKIITYLDGLDKERVKRVFGKEFKNEEKEIKRLFFLSSTYSITGEIFSRLVHVDDLNSKRPFPNGLDLPAVFNNKTAEEILFNEYKYGDKWSEFNERLSSLQEQFYKFEDWDNNYGYKGVQTALQAASEDDRYPDYMKTNAYNRKELSTALASWAHIKHDLILYQEKPFAAESGQGGGPEPPQHYSYVEPNLRFWDTALELVKWLENISKFDSTFASELKEIKDLGEKLRLVAYQQVEGKTVSSEIYDELHHVGGTIEYILFGLLETDHLSEREKSMALIADVYSYKRSNLNVAVGHADDIYVIVPINGEYYISRGSIFSYHEFIGEIFDDDQWKSKVKKGNIPDRPKWIQPIINDNIKGLEGQLEFRVGG